MKKLIEHYLSSLPRYHENPGLSRIQYFIDKNKCHLDSYTVITGGTNGKGSVVTMLENILQNSGLTAGSMKSPHVYEPSERFSFNCNNIEISVLKEILDYVRKFFRDNIINPTLADVLTASALLYFTKYSKPEILLLEVGMGGDFDPVNAVRRDLSVITGIGHDHSNVLGRYPDEIARRKAGIVRKNTPLITGELNPGALDVFREICNRENSQLIIVPPGEILDIGLNGTVVSCGDYKFTTGIPGTRQASNSALVMEIIRLMGNSFRIPHYSITEGMSKSKLPWRMEFFHEKPTVIFDGAHNKESWQNLVDTMKFFPHRNLNIISIIQQAKNTDDFPRKFPGKFNTLHLPDMKDRRYHSPRHIKESLDDFEGEIRTHESLHKAVSDSLDQSDHQDIILCTGTFKLAGYVRETVQNLITLKC
jgi:dihydrofolate synthase / folylpolyglutamate synthase